MKEIRRLINHLVGCAVAFAMVSAKVIRIKGPARYTTGNNIWQPLGVGMVLQPGTVVQTSTEKGSYVDLVLGDENAAIVQPVSYKPGIISSMASSSTAAYHP